ncbi:MAG: hypothetical protein HY459_03750 [Parcubacteria group bacterium]|nr:hypothetical protein [Parcubacteria group bacterium]
MSEYQTSNLPPSPFARRTTRPFPFIIFAAIVALLLAVAAFVNQASSRTRLGTTHPSPTPTLLGTLTVTSTTQTYRSTRFDFLVTLPRDYVIREIGDKEPDRLVGIRKETSQTFIASIRVSDRTVDEEIAKDSSIVDENENQVIVERKPTTVAGIPATEVVKENTQSGFRWSKFFLTHRQWTVILTNLPAEALTSLRFE